MRVEDNNSQRGFEKKYVLTMKRKSTLRITTCIFSLMLVSFVCSGQVVIEALPRWLFSAHFNYLHPQQPISRFLKTDQIGYQIELQYRVQYNKPFLLGGYYTESTLSRYVLTYIQSSGVGDISIREKANTRRLEAGLTAGFYPEINWFIQPYMQGRFGVCVFHSSSILTDDDTDESIERIGEFTTGAPAYGIDLGFHIVPNIWYVRGDVRIGVVGNTATPYLILDRENAGQSGIPIQYFEHHNSAGKWLKISVGVSYMY